MAEDMTDDIIGYSYERGYDQGIDDGRRIRDALHARIAELEAALRPFAAVYDENYALIGKWHDGGIQGLFLSDLLAARAALEKKND